MSNKSLKFRSFLAFMLTVACLPCVSQAAIAAQSQQPALPKGVERVTSVEGFTEYQLPDGLRVLLFPDQSKQTVTVNVTYLVGSRHENYGETGMAHLTDPLMHNWATNH